MSFQQTIEVANRIYKNGCRKRKQNETSYGTRNTIIAANCFCCDSTYCCLLVRWPQMERLTFKKRFLFQLFRLGQKMSVKMFYASRHCTKMSHWLTNKALELMKEKQ